MQLKTCLLARTYGAPWLFGGSGRKRYLTRQVTPSLASSAMLCSVELRRTRCARSVRLRTKTCVTSPASIHAKVYLSDRGAIIRSANASRNGVGLDGPPSLTEAGVRFAPDSETFRQAESWFEAQWEASTQVDDTALDFATQRFRPGRSLGGFPVRPGSLLDLIAELPRVYRRVKLSEDEPYGREEEDIALFA